MAYDRSDEWRGGRQDPRARDSEHRGRGWREDRERSFGDRDERGFFERAGDEISSWFGDEDRGSRHDRLRRESMSDDRFDDRGPSRDRFSPRGRDDDDRGDFHRPERSEGSRGYRPMAGDYSRGSDDFGGRRDHGDRDFGDRDFGDRQRSRGLGRSDFDRDDDRGFRGAAAAGGAAAAASSRAGGDHRPYGEWRQRHLDSLDRDYDDYRREHQSRFESDFGEWRERRQSKRGLMRDIREHMEVVGKDDEHVGTVDKIAGDRIVLTKSDSESGGSHHSISCTMVDRIEDNKVILDLDADKARKRWRDDDHDRALFEREDQGEAGPGMLNRSFSGTYR